MTGDPVLASRAVAAGCPKGKLHPFVVYGGLHYIRGNHAPYFTLTYSETCRACGTDSGGAGHETILQHFPQFADLAAMHLSDIDGVPMHAAGNGWYNLAGALGGFGEQYHAGNSERHMPLPVDRRDPAKPWQTTEYRHPTPDECLQLFADYFRLSLEDAAAIKSRVLAYLDVHFGDPRTIAREVWAVIVEEQKPRWKREADACIAAHALRVYGDAWAPPVPA